MALSEGGIAVNTAGFMAVRVSGLEEGDAMRLEAMDLQKMFAREFLGAEGAGIVCTKCDRDARSWWWGAEVNETLGCIAGHLPERFNWEVVLAVLAAVLLCGNGSPIRCLR